MYLISPEQLEDRMEAIMEETMVEKKECSTAIIEEAMVEKMEMPLKTKRGEELYQRFCMIRKQTRDADYEEDVKVRNLFLKIAKEQAEEAEKELYNKETEGQILNTIIEEKSGLQEAFEEMVAVKDAYEEFQKKAEELKKEIQETKKELQDKITFTEEELLKASTILFKENSKF
jgi:hypothetical protein